MDKTLEFAITMMLAILVVTSFASVFFQVRLQYSLFWADEFMRFLFIWTVFFACSLLVIQKSHIAVDLTSKRIVCRETAAWNASCQVRLGDPATVEWPAVRRASNGSVSYTTRTSNSLSVPQLVLSYPIASRLVVHGHRCLLTLWYNLQHNMRVSINQVGGLTMVYRRIWALIVSTQ